MVLCEGSVSASRNMSLILSGSGGQHNRLCAQKTIPIDFYSFQNRNRKFISNLWEMIYEADMLGSIPGVLRSSVLTPRLRILQASMRSEAEDAKQIHTDHVGVKGTRTLRQLFPYFCQNRRTLSSPLNVGNFQVASGM